MANPTVEAIIATLCATGRRDALLAAIESLLDQAGATVHVTVVVNGEHYCPALLAELEGRPEIRVCRLPEASLVRALQMGRSRVDAEFFCFLDDDDRYLPGALEARLAPLRADSTVDAVVSNGYITAGDQRQMHTERLSDVRAPRTARVHTLQQRAMHNQDSPYE